MTKKLLLLSALLISINSFSQSIATYTITFEGIWNEADHGPLPATDHWSDLVGATHNSDVVFWRMGEIATPGMELVAELGSNGTFNNEVNTAIANDDADQWLQTGFAPFAASGVATLSNIEVSESFPLITLATMIAPSPDWFSGLDSYSLLDTSGNWKDNISIDVFPYDAGTEEGNGYSTSNSASSPHVAIFDRTGTTPFNTPTAVGTITFELENVLNTNEVTFENSIRLTPNPSNGFFKINANKNISSIHIYDVLGNRVKTISDYTIGQEIATKEFNSGLYLVKISDENNRISTKRLIIN
ncbi:MAG: T9SS type A sorting domain-containing protein [bacterium]